MTVRTSSTALSLVAFLWVSSALCAQKSKMPTMEEILQRLEANLSHYDTRVPSVFCDEHVISQIVESGRHDENTTTDSVFRLKRIPSADQTTTTLVELREIKSVNGKPPTKQEMHGPSLLSGAFEGGLAVVSLNQTACMSYTLQRINKKHPDEPYVVRFSTVLTPQNTDDCLLQENSKGRAFVDPASMQVTHLELTTPHHVIIPAISYVAPVIGKRELTVDYAPVLLGGETFWMPSTISMRNTSGSGTFHMTAWLFRATYRNYHKMEVTTRILPGNEAPAP